MPSLRVPKTQVLFDLQNKELSVSIGFYRSKNHPKNTKGIFLGGRGRGGGAGVGNPYEKKHFDTLIPQVSFKG